MSAGSSMPEAARASEERCSICGAAMERIGAGSWFCSHVAAAVAEERATTAQAVAEAVQGIPLKQPGRQTGFPSREWCDGYNAALDNAISALRAALGSPGEES